MKSLHRGLVLFVAVLCAVVAAAPAPSQTTSAFTTRSGATQSCTKAERARRAHRVAMYTRQMKPARRAYFKTHRSSRARAKFVRTQNAHLKALQRALHNCRRTPPRSVPSVSVGDVSVIEGAAGTTTATLTLRLSGPTTIATTVATSTANGTAIAGSDYTAASGTVTFAAGATTTQTTVSVLGDSVVEANEMFQVALSAPSGLTIADGSATVTIVNDDTASTPPPPPSTPPPPSPSPSPPSTPSICTQTVVPGANVASAIAAAAGGTTLCLAAGTYGKISLASVSKASDVTVQPAPGAAVTIGGLSLRVVSHVRFTGAGGTMRISGLGIDTADGDAARSHHLTFDHVIWTAAVTVFARGTDQAILFDSNVFDNLSVDLYEGRLSVRGYHNTAPVGVTVSNSHFGGGGCSDGVQVVGDAYGVQIGPGNEFEDLRQGSCAAHVDPIQLYGSSHTLVTGNFFHDNSTGIMAPDGGDHEQFVNNVFVVASGGYPQVFQLGSQVGTVVRHNTFAGTSSDIEFCGNKSGLPPSTGCIIRDNVYMGSVYHGTVSGYTEDHNLCRVGESDCAAASDVHGVPVFVGGANPTTYAGYRLASGSPGKGAASDGTDIGIGG